MHWIKRCRGLSRLKARANVKEALIKPGVGRNQQKHNTALKKYF